MKSGGSMIAFCLVLLSGYGCKPKADSSVTGNAGGTPRRGNCSNVNDWLASPVTCQKDKDQIIVTEVFTKVEDELFNSVFERAKKKGYQICLGAIRYFNDKDQTENGWKTGYGVWLNGFSGLGGCHTGTDYRNVYSGAKGNKVVTPFLTKGESTQGEYSTVTHNIFLPDKPTLQLGKLHFTRHKSEFHDNLYFTLCSQGFEKICELSISEGTLKIKLDGDAKAPCIERGTSYPDGEIIKGIKGRKCVDGKWR